VHPWKVYNISLKFINKRTKKRNKKRSYKPMNHFCGRVCHGLGYFGILLAMSWPRIFLDTFGNIMA
jgi:hypothetical protein